MARLFILICFLIMLNCVGRGACFGDDVEMPALLDRFRQVVATIKILEDNSQRSQEEEQQFQNARTALRQRVQDVVECRLHERKTMEEKVALYSRRINALREIMYGEFRLAQGVNY